MRRIAVGVHVRDLDEIADGGMARTIVICQARAKPPADWKCATA